MLLEQQKDITSILDGRVAIFPRHNCITWKSCPNFFILPSIFIFAICSQRQLFRVSLNWYGHFLEICTIIFRFPFMQICLLAWELLKRFVSKEGLVYVWLLSFINTPLCSVALLSHPSNWQTTKKDKGSFRFTVPPSYKWNAIHTL